ncbi:MAG: SDR family NAD(P)-dependent oxidoreductase [Solirubrobacteraceae bacterium]
MSEQPSEPSEIFVPELLEAQVVLVTGGGTGLGKATAIELVKCGAKVVIAGRREEVLRNAASEIGKRCDWVVADIRERCDAEQLIAEVLKRHGRLDILVNNAGGQYFVPAEAISIKGWRAVWRLNVDGTSNMANAAFDGAMRSAGRGAIINVTLSPHNGMPGMAHSGSARAAVEALTKELAQRWAAHGISVVAVAAGHFDTEALDKYPEVVRAGSARSVPLQRLGRAQEHAWLVTLLASPVGEAFNGSTITLDGARDNWFGPWPPPTLADESGVVPTEERR